MDNSTRRQFLKSSTVIAGASALAMQSNPSLNAQEPDEPTKNFREQLLECLGGDWPQQDAIVAKVEKTKQEDGYQLQWVTYKVTSNRSDQSADDKVQRDDQDPNHRIPAIILIPDGVSATSPAPAVAIWHQHNGEYHLGKSEPAGLAGNKMHHTGVALAKQGFVVLCPDALCFEERQDPDKKLNGNAFERFEFLRQVVDGRCMAWKNILDMRRSIDYLVSRPEVDKENLGCYGHSMGSTHTWLIGPWEPRLKCFVGNCCLPTYAAIHRTKLLHCFPNFIPGIHQHGDTPDIAALIAPRALHLNFGETDGGSPIKEVREGIEKIKLAYKTAGAENKFSHFIEENTGHVLSPKMWQRTLETFNKHLKT